MRVTGVHMPVGRRFQVFDHEEWDAWHYGINAEAQSSFTM